MGCGCSKGSKQYGGIKRPPLSYKAGGKSPKASMSCGQVKRSSRPGKKIMKLYCMDGKKKLVHAGAKGYGHNYSSAARKSFKARHKCSTAKPGTAKHLACTELWAGKGGSKKSSPKGRKGKYAVGGPYLNIDPYNPLNESDFDSIYKGKGIGEMDLSDQAQRQIKRRQRGRNIGATAYGVLEGLVDTVTFGATDKLTDMGYEALAGTGRGQSAARRAQSDRYRVGVGQVIGATTGAILTGGAATGSAIATTDFGTLANEESQALQTGLNVAGTVAGVAVGNTSGLEGTGGAFGDTAVGDVSANLGKSSSFGGTGTGPENLLNEFAPNLKEGIDGFREFQELNPEGTLREFLQQNPEMFQKVVEALGIGSGTQVNKYGGPVSYKAGGRIPYQNGGPHNDGVLHMGNAADYFNSASVYHENPRYNDLIRRRVYAGTHGYNPQTGALVKLDTPVKVDPATQAMATKEYTKATAGTRGGITDARTDAYVKSLPKDQREAVEDRFQEQRRQGVERELGKMYQNPITYAPAAIYSAGLAGPAIGALGTTARSLATAPLTIGSRTVPFINPTTLVGAGFGVKGAYNLGTDIDTGYYSNPNIPTSQKVERGAITALDVLSAPGMGNALLQTGKGAYNVGKTGLKNTYKINPFAEKLGRYNRVIDEGAVLDAQTSGVIRSKAPADKISGPGVVNLDRRGTTRYASFGDAPPIQEYADKVINRGGTPFVVSTNRPMQVSTLGRHGAGVTMFPVDKSGKFIEEFPASEAQIFEYQPHWLRGYKKVSGPKGEVKPFQSEINWADWNPDTPKYPELIKEYNAIEKSTKEAGTWMKNADGTPFQGQPEEFIQQQSSHFKKAFPKGFGTTYRGTGSNRPLLKQDLYTAEQENFAAMYAPGDLGVITGPGQKVGGTHKLYYPKSEKSAAINVQDQDWLNLTLNDLKSADDWKDQVRSNIRFQEKQLANRKEQLKKINKKIEETGDPNIGAGPSGATKRNILDLISSINTRIERLNGQLTKPAFESTKTLEQLKKAFPGKTSTDDIMDYMLKHDIDNVKLDNIIDEGYGTEVLLNNRPGNRVKSTLGNVGFFDMTNPNIYKATIPAVGGVAGYGLLQDSQPEGFAYGGGLRRWFKEKWVDVKTGKPCGRSGKEKSKRAYPYCRPSRKVSSKTPATSKHSEAKSRAKQKTGPGRVKPISQRKKKK